MHYENAIALLAVQNFPGRFAPRHCALQLLCTPVSSYHGDMENVWPNVKYKDDDKVRA